MPALTATAPAKIILFGEHAVVYGQPAIAVPVNQLRARASILPAVKAPPGQIHIQAADIGLEAELQELPEDHPLRILLHNVVQVLDIQHIPACRIRMTTTIPIAAGMGSGAAASVALIRAWSSFLGEPLGDDRVNELAYEIEKIYHGTPSGIDNTVITYNRPVYYIRDYPIQVFQPGRTFHLLIADSGLPARTAITVGNVRQAWLAQPQLYEQRFRAIGDVVRSAKEALETGRLTEVGDLMDRNQELLSSLNVSSPDLDRLIQSARQAGALGAKLTGGGGGGNMIALVEPDCRPAVRSALLAAGAVQVIEAQISPSP